MYNGTCVCVFGYERVGGECVPAQNVDGDGIDADADADGDGADLDVTDDDIGDGVEDTEGDVDGEGVEDTEQDVETTDDDQTEGDTETAFMDRLNFASQCLDQFGGSIKSLGTRDNYLYMLAGASLLIYDISDSSAPVLVQKHYVRHGDMLSINNEHLLIHVSGVYDPRKPENNDFVFTTDKGYFHYSLTEGIDPVLRGVVDKGHVDWRFHTQLPQNMIPDPTFYDRFFVNRLGAAMCTVDVRNTMNIMEWTNVGHQEGIAALGNHVFSIKSQDFSVWTNADGAISRCTLLFLNYGAFGGEVASGNYLYAANRSSALHVFDISSPCEPVLLRAVPDAGFSLSIFLKGDYILIPDGGISIVNISNPGAPFIVGKAYREEYLSDMTNKYALGGNTFFHSSNADLHAYDLQQLPAIEKASITPLPIDLDFVFPGDLTIGVSKKNVYGIDKQSDMPHVRWKRGELEIEAAERLSGERLALVAESKAEEGPEWIGKAAVLLDISPYSGPLNKGVALLGEGDFIVEEGDANTLFVARIEKESMAGDCWIRAYNLMGITSDTGEIPEVGAIAFPGHEELLHFAVLDSGEGLALVKIGDSQYRFDLLDLSDLQNIEKIREFPTNCHALTGFEIHEHFLIEQCSEVADAGSLPGFALQDISDTSNIAIKGKVFSLYNGAFTINGNNLLANLQSPYAGPEGWKIMVYDISDPTSPGEVGEIMTPGQCQQMTIYNGKLYVADGSAGLSVFDLACLEL